MDTCVFIIFAAERQLLLPDKPAPHLHVIHFTVIQMEPTEYASSETLIKKWPVYRVPYKKTQ